MTTHVNNKMQARANSVKPLEASEEPCGPALLGIEDAAVTLGLTPWTLRRWISDRKITSCKVGARRLVPVTEIDRIISAGMEQRDETPPGGTRLL